MEHNSFSNNQSINIPLSRSYKQGKFGRLFPGLPPWFSPEEKNSEISTSLKYLETLVLDGKKVNYFLNIKKKGENPHIPAGYTYFGQFLTHDFSFDSTTLSERELDSEFLTNFRTPALDLDSVYGSGPNVTPFFYNRKTRSDPTSGITFPEYITENYPKNESIKGKFIDLPRLLKTKQVVIPDVRNDENIFISQLHTAFLLFHNKVVKRLANKYSDPEVLFFKARRKVKWCYQWLILGDYLPRVTGLNFGVKSPFEVKSNDSRIQISHNKNGYNKIPRIFYNWRNLPFIPLEFSGAVFRFGHSQVRSEYIVNHSTRLKLLEAFARSEKLSPRTFVDWSLFFFDPMSVNGENLSQIISPELVFPLLTKIPDLGESPKKIQSLALRNLYRGLKLRLPSGQDVARLMGIEPLTYNEVFNKKYREIDKELDGIYRKKRFPQFFKGENGEKKKERFFNNTPLWYYVLMEAYLEKKGKTLGPVGGRIVAEVLSGLIEGDKSSFVNLHPNWKPYEDEDIMSLMKNKKNSFMIIDFLKCAGCYEGGTFVEDEKVS